MNTATPPITHRPDAHRFELQQDGHLAHLDYVPQPGALALTHTIVPDALGGRGIGSALARHALNHAVAQGLKVDPQCSFVKAYIDKHPEFQAHSLAHAAS